VGTGLGAKRAAVNDGAFAVSDRVFIKRGLREVPMDARQTFETKFLGAVGAVSQSCFVHE
jgi:hypothetical protein